MSLSAKTNARLFTWVLVLSPSPQHGTQANIHQEVKGQTMWDAQWNPHEKGQTDLPINSATRVTLGSITLREGREPVSIAANSRVGAPVCARSPNSSSLERGIGYRAARKPL